jgi:hypothetical protein
MAENKACKRKYEYPDAQFAAGMKVTTVKENRRAEQRGPAGINQLRKNGDLTPNEEGRYLSIQSQHPFHQEGRLVLLYPKMDQYTLTVGMRGLPLSLPELTKLTKMCKR